MAQNVGYSLGSIATNDLRRIHLRAASRAWQATSSLAAEEMNRRDATMDMAKQNALVLALEDWVRPDDILRMPPECTENLVSGCGRFAAIDVLRRAVELRKPKMDHIDVLVQMISVRSLSINAGVLLPHYLRLRPKTRAALLDRMYTSAIISGARIVSKDEIAHELRRLMDARRQALFEGTLQVLSVAPWLTELEAVRVNMETFEALVAARPDLKRASMVSNLCTDPCDQSGRIKIIAKLSSGSDALSETAFRNQLYTKRPDRELISRFKTKHQEGTYEVLFDVLPWLSKDPNLIARAAERPDWQTLFKLMLARGFSLHSDTWTGRPLVVAWMRRVAVQPKEAIVSPEIETLEWLSRFALRSHVVRAIRSGHRVRSDFWKSASDPEMAKLLRAARWPMKWTPSVHGLMSPATRNAIFGFMVCARKLPRMPLEMLQIIFSSLVDNTRL